MAARQVRDILARFAAVLILVPGSAALASQDVEDWVSGDLADYVFEQLTTAPRFASASVHLVVFADGQPVSRTDGLSLALRDSLRRRLAGRKGVRLGWQPDPAAPVQQPPSTAEDCEAMRPGLLIGIELRVGSDHTATASMRALDDVERRWVPGFGREWQGRLSAAQRRSFAAAAVDRAYLGRRDVPYSATETDLIASHLAHDLRCRLMRQVTGEYRLAMADTAADPPENDDVLAAVPKLVRHQVGGVSSLRLLPAAEAANTQLRGTLHPVAGQLHQYWLVLEPLGTGSDLQPLASSVYVELPANSPRDIGEPFMPVSTAGVLGDMRIVQLAGNPACLRAGSNPAFRGGGGERCAALRVTVASDAVVFILNHQQNLGLVRLGDARCAPRPSPHVLRRGESVTLRVPDLFAVDDAQWSVVTGGSLAPAGDVYYAIASDDGEAARVIAKHVAALPLRCSDAVRPGLDGAALAYWFRGLTAELETRAHDVAWRAVQTRNVL